MLYINTKININQKKVRNKQINKAVIKQSKQ